MVESVVTCFEGPRKITLKKMNLRPAEDQVLVKIHQASICGTDKLHYSGELPEDVKTRLPLCPWGHEGGGTVVEVGSKVREFSEGDRVMSFSHGTYAEYCLFTVPYGCLPAPEWVDMEIACLGEPLSCAVYAAALTTKHIQLGDIVAVIGQGFAGQVIQQGLKRGGAEKVVVLDLVDEKLELAKKLGADVAINPAEEDPLNVIMDFTDGRGVDLVVEASGSGQGLNTASRILRHNGTIAIYSHYMKPFIVDMYRWHEDSFQILQTCLIHRTQEEMVVDVREAFRLVKKGIFNIKPLINRKYNLSEIEEAFERELSDRASVKTAITP